MMPIDYSFIIRVMNRHELFGRCLESVLWQDYPSYEVIVVDCGSNPKITIPKDQQIKLVRIESEDGTWLSSASFNAGIASAKGERLVLMGCDGIIVSDLLGFVHSFLEKRQPQKLQVYWRRFNLNPEGLCWLIDLGPLSSEKCFQGLSPELLIAQGLGAWENCTPLGDFLVIDRSPVVEIGGYEERFTGWGLDDNDMMERLRLLGYQEYWGKQFKMIHQFHPYPKAIDEDFQRNVKIFQQLRAAGHIVRNGGPQNFEKYRDMRL